VLGECTNLISRFFLRRHQVQESALMFKYCVMLYD